MSLWRLEILRLLRTHRIWILLGVFVFFGALGPLTARFLPEIVEAVGGGVEIAVPPPSPELAMSGYLGNALQIGVLAVAFVAAAALAFDARPEMAVYLRTRTTIRQILTPRYATNIAAVVLSFFIGTVIAYVGSVLLIDAPRLGGSVVAALLLGVYLSFAVALTGLAASLVRSVPGAALITVGALIVIGIIGLIPPIDPWLPSNLVGSFDALISGAEFDYWRSLVVTIVLSVGCISASFVLMGRREV
jgi:ABC-2 type transport system permease protein